MNDVGEMLRNQRTKSLELLSSIPNELLDRRLSEDVWSPAQVFEHIARMDVSVASIVQYALANPLPYIEEERPLHRLTDRRYTLQAPKSVEPTVQFWTWEALVEKLDDDRTMLEGVFASAGSEEVLRNLTSSFLHPIFGQLSLLQWGRFVAGHEERHNLQIAEWLKLHN